MNKNKNIKEKGYRFVGWYVDPERKRRVNPGGILPKVVTLYDKWIPIVYPITYNTNGGMNSRKNPRKVTIESGALMLFPARKPNQKFVTWLYKDRPVDVLPARICHPVHLEALYSDFDTVHFETFGGGRIEDKTVSQEGYIHEFRPPMRMGSVFEGWFWDKEYQWPFYFDQPIRQSCTIYAKWKSVEYSITYDCQGGFAARQNPKTYTYYTETIPLLPAVKKGYEFIGWFDSRGNCVHEIENHSLGNWHLIAHFRKL